MIEILKTILFGIVEGITEWLPISSTGHMILLNEFVQLDVSQTFWEIFLVVIQLGAILAVVLVYWTDIFPFRVRGRWGIDGKKMNMWGKILVASIPAGVIGILFDDVFNALFYNYQTVSIMLILFGILFLIIENRNRYMVPRVRSIAAISYGTAFLIGVFQLIAAVFPGTSRSGATIVGALLLGVSRTTAAEFTFFLPGHPGHVRRQRHQAAQDRPALFGQRVWSAGPRHGCGVCRVDLRHQVPDELHQKA